ncbi:hypothetical protein E2C01_082357 [Portunus trituberculatus]|uniref:Uncharacterized protein n=1 Tax=Portunus trituberculatus TaxID=210409 RepID=A0A5B7IY98_PORTR|nr:hypothetical protein [Portunus trituberculatus]
MSWHVNQVLWHRYCELQILAHFAHAAARSVACCVQCWRYYPQPFALLFLHFITPLLHTSPPSTLQSSHVFPLIMPHSPLPFPSYSDLSSTHYI